ncbi:MAG: hypothetical protein AAB609_02915 [Patescibacteria group bacterium]
MNIGFDLDKIFIDFPPFVPGKLIDRLYKQKSDGVLLYRIPSRLEQTLRIVSHYPIFRSPLTKNIRFVKELTNKQKNNNKYYLISSRFGFLKKPTEALIKRHEFNEIFDAMFFNFENKQPHLFKHGVITKLRIDRYVDDDLPLLEFLNKKNKKTKFFWLNNNTEKIINDNLIAITRLSKMFQ